MGFIVSSALSWKPNVESKLLECNRIFGFIKRSLPSSSRKSSLYKPLILPILLYSAPAWSPSLTMLHQLELFQHKVLRWINNRSSYVSGLQALKILPVCYCRSEMTSFFFGNSIMQLSLCIVTSFLFPCQDDPLQSGFSDSFAQNFYR